MLLPVALLVVATTMQLLGRFVSAEDIGDEFVILATQTPGPVHDWRPWVYFVPILTLVAFAILIFSIRLYEFIGSTSATGPWISVLPVTLIAIAFGLTLIMLIYGVTYNYEINVTMASIFSVILIGALVANWLVVSNQPNREQPGIKLKLLSGVVCSIICAAVVGAGFGALIGMDARDATQERTGGNSESTVDTTPPPGVSSTDENAQTRAPDGSEAANDADEVNGNPWFTVASFFLFVFALLTTGIWWLTKFFGWRELVSQNVNAVRDVAKDAVRASMHPQKSAVDAIAKDIAGKVGKGLPQSRATEFAIYIQNITLVATGKPPETPNSLVDPWLASALREGIASVCEGSGGNKPDYHYIYARAVQGVAEPLYDEFSDVDHLGPEALPTDVLIAAKNMAMHVADLIYRANIHSVPRKHRPRRWHYTFAVLPPRLVRLAFEWTARLCTGVMTRIFHPRTADADDLASQCQGTPFRGTGRNDQGVD